MSYLNNQIGYRDALLETRSVIKKDNYTILEVDGLVKNMIPGYVNCDVTILGTPEMGASFADYLVTAHEGGKNDSIGGNGIETFLYVMEGEVTVKNADKEALEKAIQDAEVAAKEHADNAVAALVEGAPETLNTLDELAAALKDNADIVQVLEDAIATKASAQDLNDLSSTVSANKTELDEVIKALQDRADALEGADETFSTNFAKLQEAVAKNTEDIGTEKERALGAEAELLAAINKLTGDLSTESNRLVGLINNKADATEIVTLQSQITANANTLNSKVDTVTFNEELEELAQVVASQETELKGYVDGRIGDIAETTTLKAYIDAAVGSGGTASAEAIATAKAEAIAASKDYTDSQLSWISYNPA